LSSPSSILAFNPLHFSSHSIHTNTGSDNDMETLDSCLATKPLPRNHAQRDRQHGELINPLLFFQKKEAYEITLLSACMCSSPNKLV
jgi:hypothetical protein